MSVKWGLLALIRSAGLLPYADRLKFIQHRLASLRRNVEFERAHPDFAVPPADLAFDAYNHVDWANYFRSGLRHAELYARIIRDTLPKAPLAIYEWGCGPGRIIRHMRQVLSDFPVTLTASDCNERTIAWCREHIPDVDFHVNGPLPPAPFIGDRFDIVYNFSVFTHLSREAQRDWTADLHRVLKPGGLLICSTHGDLYRHLLTRRDEMARYEDGEVVIQGGYREGRKWFLALHPPRYVVKQLLASFENVRRVEVPPDAAMSQDLWIAQKPLTKT